MVTCHTVEWIFYGDKKQKFWRLQINFILLICRISYAWNFCKRFNRHRPMTCSVSLRLIRFWAIFNAIDRSLWIRTFSIVAYFAFKKLFIRSFLIDNRISSSLRLWVGCPRSGQRRTDLKFDHGIRKNFAYWFRIGAWKFSVTSQIRDFQVPMSEFKLEKGKMAKLREHRYYW